MTTTGWDEWRGAEVVDTDGRELGTIAGYWPESAVGDPEFALVDRGFLGSARLMVPLALAAADGPVLRLQVGRDVVDAAPGPGADSEGRPVLDTVTATQVREYYDQRTTAAPATAADTAPGTVGDTGADASVVRSEEHLQGGTAVVEAGRVRLRKYVTTHLETVTVPVRREHVVLETLPVEPGQGGAPQSDPDRLFPESEILYETVLYEERPSVSTVVVPVERVQVRRQTEFTEETVTADVRTEQVEVVQEPRSDARP